jgi:hypothetical protein
MKKLLLLSTIIVTLSMYRVNAQSHIIGKIDADGNSSISVLDQQAKNILESVSNFTEPQPFQPTDITLSTMPQGEICLTGYIKNPVGKIIRGFRIVCIQDDENNLIVKPGSHVERINGRQF